MVPSHADVTRVLKTKNDQLPPKNKSNNSQIYLSIQLKRATAAAAGIKLISARTPYQNLTPTRYRCDQIKCVTPKTYT